MDQDSVRLDPPPHRSRASGGTSPTKQQPTTPPPIPSNPRRPKGVGTPQDTGFVAPSSRWSSEVLGPDPPDGVPDPPNQEAIVPPGRPPPTSKDSSSEGGEQVLSLMREPETRPISQEQLVAEVKGIYAGLVMVEAKCIEVDNAQNAQRDQPHSLNNEQWQALIALHRTLLHEHHDFFLASQHPSASVALQRLASKYSMPARMWRHGIHSFLELLRHRLPGSLEHMLTFVYLAYSMMALLYETVPAFSDTWVECLGDLGRYRMAIEDDNIHDREIWTGVSRHWYSKASDTAPTTGRLYHHLAILSRPNALQQLFFYTKSLCVAIPFVSARESILTILEPVLNDSNTRLPPIDADFVKLHAILFTGRSKEQFSSSLVSYIGRLDSHIARTTKQFMEAGYYTAITNICGLLHFGNEDSPLFRALKPRRQEETDIAMSDADASTTLGEPLKSALELFSKTNGVVFRRYGDHNTYPFVNVTLAFLWHLVSHSPKSVKLLENYVQWSPLAETLNTILHSADGEPRFEDAAFPTLSSSKEPHRPLPEDYAARGLLWSESYYPDTFYHGKIEDDERYLEVASNTEVRKTRILWLGARIAKNGDFLMYDKSTRQFSAGSRFISQDEAGAQQSSQSDVPMQGSETDMFSAAEMQAPTIYS